MLKNPIKTEFGVFKEADYGSAWVLDTALQLSYFNGLPAKVTIKGLEANDNQPMLLGLLKEIVQIRQGEFRKLEEEIFENYEDYGEAVGFEEIPGISKPYEVWLHLRNLHIYIYKSEKKKNPFRIGITFDCAWEEEHGLGVLLDGKFEVLEVGTQDIAF